MLTARSTEASRVPMHTLETMLRQRSDTLVSKGRFVSAIFPLVSYVPGVTLFQSAGSSVLSRSLLQRLISSFSTIPISIHHGVLALRFLSWVLRTHCMVFLLHYGARWLKRMICISTAFHSKVPRLYDFVVQLN